ncbi:MAG: hypothetical protein P2A85_10555 [Microcoleus anatoxicus]
MPHPPLPGRYSSTGKGVILWGDRLWHTRQWYIFQKYSKSLFDLS